MTSRSVEGRDFPDFETLDAKITSALMKIISTQLFRRRDRAVEPKENIVKGLYSLKIRDSVQLQTLLAMYDRDN